MLRIITICIAAMCSLPLLAQDIHWTQYDKSPIQLNPARAGNFYGTARLSGIARTQSNTIANKGFFTYAFGLDAPVVKGFRKNDWIGFGLSFATDKAGTLEIGIKSQTFAGSYHLAMNKKATTYLTLGVGIESYGRKIGNSEAAIFRDGTQASIGGMGANMDFKSATGYVGGLELKSTLNKRTVFRVGGKYSRIGKVRVGLAPTGRYQVPNRFTLHTDLEMQTGPKTKFIPSLLYENYGSASAFVFQGKGKYLVDKENSVVLTGGLGYRFGDALQVLVGLGWGDFDVGIGYDLPVSGQSSDAIPLGGLEVGITYMLKIYKEPKVDPIIFCPRF